LHFALVSEFADAPPVRTCRKDADISLKASGTWNRELNERHGAGAFSLSSPAFLSESEQRWLGWERKRGKLEQLNRFLMGESRPS
jgi:hypothetical protein